MYLLICKMFENENVDIDTKEIEHSYCPGRFDLSIDGKNLLVFHNDGYVEVLQFKFIYVLKVREERAEMMHEFYKRALKGEVTKFKYPDIKP